MPAATSPLQRPGPRRLHQAAVALGLALVATLVVATVSPLEARDWSGQIAAMRAGQLYYEGIMRAADAEIRNLKQARKKLQRKVRHAQRTKHAASERRSQRGRDLETTRRRLLVARAILVAPAFETPPPPDAATAILALVDPGGDETDGADAVPDEGGSAGVVLPVLSAGTASLTVGPDVTAEDVVALERELKQERKGFEKASKRVRRAAANLRRQRRSLAAVKARQRAATSRRAGAEAGLASRILAMSTLAQRRVAKKTNVRPGVNSGFVWPASGGITQRYGCTGFRLNPPRGSCSHFHDGIDIAGYRGSPIRAAAVGVVSYVGWNPWDQHGRAFMIVVAHPGGYETLYGHVLPTRRVRVGQLVRRGELIGYMGNTGRSTGVHLHLEVRRGRTTLDPLAFL